MNVIIVIITSTTTTTITTTKLYVINYRSNKNIPKNYINIVYISISIVILRFVYVVTNEIIIIMNNLTTIRNTQKEVHVSFYLVKESQSAFENEEHGRSLRPWDHPQSKKKVTSRPLESKRFVSSATVTQQRLREIFEDDSFMIIVLNAKLQSNETHRNWSILQQDTPSDDMIMHGNQSGNKKRNHSMSYEGEEEEEEENRQQHDDLSKTATTKVVSLSDSMKKYHELTVSLPMEQYTETAIMTVICMMLATSKKTERRLSYILTKEEILDSIALCNYLGVKAFRTWK